MEMQINCTQDGIISYPLHKHSNYEIMLYLQGEGVLRTPTKNYKFTPGTIIIVPPNFEHGSASKNGFKNISICCEFENVFHFKDIVSIYDNNQGDGKALATLIYNNRHKNKDYIHKLCSAYSAFILQNTNMENSINTAVNQIVNYITNNFYDSNISLNNLLQMSGYAEDYIRAYFKKSTGKTPNRFLTNIRIKHAVFLIDIYATALTLQEIAHRCGYTDYVYFSKKFKEVIGISPANYKNSLINSKKNKP